MCNCQVDEWTVTDWIVNIPLNVTFILDKPNLTLAINSIRNYIIKHYGIILAEFKLTNDAIDIIHTTSQSIIWKLVFESALFIKLSYRDPLRCTLDRSSRHGYLHKELWHRWTKRQMTTTAFQRTTMEGALTTTMTNHMCPEAVNQELEEAAGPTSTIWPIPSNPLNIEF